VLIQGAAVLTAIVYSGFMSFVLLKLIGLVIPLRAAVSDESTGLDITQHGEEAYMHTGGATAQMHQSKTTLGVQPMLNPIKSDA
jgi:Amt family ammonium transporter